MKNLLILIFCGFALVASQSPTPTPTPVCPVGTLGCPCGPRRSCNFPNVCTDTPGVCVAPTPTPTPTTTPTPSPSPSPPTPTREPGVCGNGYLESGEECDDGNNFDYDGCHNDCVIENCASVVTCETDLIWMFQCTDVCSEQHFWILDDPIALPCVDANKNITLSCNNQFNDPFFASDVTNDVYIASCSADGDGGSSILNLCFFNSADPSGFGYYGICSSTTCEDVCGDGIIGTEEECEDGNPNSGDGCFQCMLEEKMGCTLTQGYWKNHFENWPEELQDENFCGDSYLDILETPSSNGDAYYILAHQYIAYLLNIANGATASGETLNQLEECAASIYGIEQIDCDDVLEDKYPKQSDAREDALICSELFSAFNEGITGPGHCDDYSDSIVQDNPTYFDRNEGILELVDSEYPNETNTKQKNNAIRSIVKLEYFVGLFSSLVLID